MTEELESTELARTIAKQKIAENLCARLKAEFKAKTDKLEAENKQLLSYLKEAHNCWLCAHRGAKGPGLNKYCEGCFGSGPNNWEISAEALEGGG